MAVDDDDAEVVPAGFVFPPIQRVDSRDPTVLAETIEHMARVHCDLATICLVVDLSAEVLVRDYQKPLLRGRAAGRMEIASAAHGMAISGNEPSATLFAARARLGMRDQGNRVKDAVDHAVDGAGEVSIRDGKVDISRGMLDIVVRPDAVKGLLDQLVEQQAEADGDA